jgi:hypothetical protein
MVRAVRAPKRGPVLGKFHLAKGPFSVAPLYLNGSMDKVHCGLQLLSINGANEWLWGDG